MAWLEKIGETGHGTDPYLVAQSLEVAPLSLEGRERPSGAGSMSAVSFPSTHYGKLLQGRWDCGGREVMHVWSPPCMCTRAPAESLKVTSEQACGHRPFSHLRLLSE